MIRQRNGQSTGSDCWIDAVSGSAKTRTTCARGSSWLRYGPLLADRVDSLQREFQPLPPELGTGDDLLNILEHMRIADLFPQLFKKGMNFCEYEEHFPAHSRLDEQLLAQCPVQHERRSHVPVSANLAQPVIFLRSHGSDDLHAILGALRPEFIHPPVSRFAHFRLAAAVAFLDMRTPVRI
jgi:hypothetical protein